MRITKKIKKSVKMKKASQVKKDVSASFRINSQVKKLIIAKYGGIQAFIDKCIDKEFEVTKEVIREEEFVISPKKR